MNLYFIHTISPSPPPRLRLALSQNPFEPATIRHHVFASRVFAFHPRTTVGAHSTGMLPAYDNPDSYDGHVAYTHNHRIVVFDIDTVTLHIFFPVFAITKFKLHVTRAHI